MFGSKFGVLVEVFGEIFYFIIWSHDLKMKVTIVIFGASLPQKPIKI